MLASTLAIVLPSLSLAQDISDDRIKALIAETLRENPDLVLEALQALEARQAEAQAAAAAAVLTDERAVLELSLIHIFVAVNAQLLRRYRA